MIVQGVWFWLSCSPRCYQWDPGDRAGGPHGHDGAGHQGLGQQDGVLPADQCHHGHAGCEHHFFFKYDCVFFQTNVPEPFQAEDETEDSLKEGLPAGLSDSQVTCLSMFEPTIKHDVECWYWLFIILNYQY